MARGCCRLDSQHPPLFRRQQAPVGMSGQPNPLADMMAAMGRGSGGGGNGGANPMAGLMSQMVSALTHCARRTATGTVRTVLLEWYRTPERAPMTPLSCVLCVLAGANDGRDGAWRAWGRGRRGRQPDGRPHAVDGADDGCDGPRPGWAWWPAARGRQPHGRAQPDDVQCAAAACPSLWWSP